MLAHGTIVLIIFLNLSDRVLFIGKKASSIKNALTNNIK
jgi:hypothetical protein